MKIGFIGLGIMGESMCENIVKKHDDTVYCFDFIPAKVELLASKGAVPCKDSVELAENMGLSGLALARYDARTSGLAPANRLDVFLDEHFDNARMERVYPNAKKT